MEESSPPGLAQPLTDGQARARHLEFRSFALLAGQVLVGLTGIWFSVLGLAVPVMSAIGVGLAVAAWRTHERRPRFVAPGLAVIHGAVLLSCLYLAVLTFWPT